MKAIIYSILSGIIFLLPVPIKAQFLVDLESGAAFTGNNTVRIPGDQGTRFSLKNNLQSETAFFYRLQLSYTLKSRHTFSLLYAPLKTKSEGIPDKDILFKEVLFPANTQLKGTYKFNSYRLKYRYDIIKREKLEFGIGITAKIRDAKIALASPEQTSEKTNVGFVPLINFRLFWNIDDKFGLLLDGDALAAPQGRAEDVLIAATFKLSDSFSIRTGYRILEGGADNDEVYNFSLFNYASFGITYTLKKPKE